MVSGDLVAGNEQVQNETPGQFYERLKTILEVARKNLKQAVEMVARYYDGRHRLVTYNMGQLVLLSTMNLRIKDTPTKLQR